MDLYQHFRKEEHPFIDQVLSWKEQVELVYEKKLSDFLDPREQDIIRSLIGTANDTIQLAFEGAHAHAERKRAILAPYYEEPQVEDFQIVVMQAAYPEKFVQLTHRDAMGAFLSLGIKRKKLGDIVVENGIIQIALAKEIAPYVQANLTSIKHAKVSFAEVPVTAFVLPEVTWKEADKTVSSLRLDAILAEIYQISRKQAQEAIVKGLVKVNYRTVEDSKFILQADDLLSLRGKGRAKLLAIKGQTKKDKIRITAARLV